MRILNKSVAVELAAVGVECEVVLMKSVYHEA